MKWIICETSNEDHSYTAGSKARQDVEDIALSLGYRRLCVNSDKTVYGSVAKKLQAHLVKYQSWKNAIRHTKKGDTLLIQLPSYHHTIFFKLVLEKLRKKGVSIIGIIHDLESIRNILSNKNTRLAKARLYLEEVSSLKCIDKLIVHNNRMKKLICGRYRIPKDRIVCLEIFDYLYDFDLDYGKFEQHKPVVIAGNLDKSKCGYIYDLPNNVRFNLYGTNYDENQSSNNSHYLGKFDPDELPKVIDGSFGLVWDGPVSKTCSGMYGEYLKYNNPHKTSLYLAAGLPVIIWEKAALAGFVNNNGVGIVVGSIEEIPDAIDSLSDKEYETLVKNAMRISNRLKCGFYLKKALGMC